MTAINAIHASDPNRTGPEVYLLSEIEPEMKPAIGVLARELSVQALDRSALEAVHSSQIPLIIANDVAKANQSPEFRRLMRNYLGKKYFLLSIFNRRTILQIHDFPNVEYFVAPDLELDLLASLRQDRNAATERNWDLLNPVQRQALRVSLKSFEDSFLKARTGEPLPVEEIKESSDLIMAATADTTLDDWMGHLRQHHNYTFRHSMFVSGTLSAFALSLGIRGQDLQDLVVGGLLHDLGKTEIPLALLDKPSRLDDREMRLMKNHAAAAGPIFEQQSGLAKSIQEMALYHHERIDGAGYPNGLKGGQINDFVRMAAIGDIYSALVDKRAYKPRIPKEEALDIMLSMEGALDMTLVKSFRDFIL